MPPLWKAEAAADARYLHDLLQLLLQADVYLDSSNLTDLRKLFNRGVAQSETLILIASASVLHSPWCLLEIWKAHLSAIPVIILAKPGFSMDGASRFLHALESELDIVNPGALDEVMRQAMEMRAAMQEEDAGAKVGQEESSRSSMASTPAGRKSRAAWSSGAAPPEVEAAATEVQRQERGRQARRSPHTPRLARLHSHSSLSRRRALPAGAQGVRRVRRRASQCCEPQRQVRGCGQQPGRYRALCTAVYLSGQRLGGAGRNERGAQLRENRQLEQWRYYQVLGPSRCRAIQE